MADARQERIRALLLGLVRAMADEPDAVQVNLVTSQGANVLRIYADSLDTLRFNADRGRTMRSLQTIVNCSAAKEGFEFNLELAK